MEETELKVLREWSWEENKQFEVALAVVDEQHPHRWEVVAAMIGSGHQKTAEDVHDHYVFLLEDLHLIHSGRFDHKLVGLGDRNFVQYNNLLVQLNLE